jgi:Fe-S-cluster containining protein
MWAADGGQVIVLVEAFLSDGPGLPVQQREHAERRSALVRSADAEACVAITFAAYNVGPCRNLDEDNLCRIYERRPLVCRIYPMEINPHIPLNPATKECPTDSWDKGPELIVGGELVDRELSELIHRSRQADRDDIRMKDAICALLGIRTTALKGDGFTAYLPDMAEFAAIIDDLTGQALPEWSSEWQFHVSRDDVAEQLMAAGAQVAMDTPANYSFISLRMA